MPLKINNSKFINNLKHIVILLIGILGMQALSAQEIINDAVVNQPTVKKDSTKTKIAKKVDGVAAVVGDYIILESDVDKAFLQLQAQGINTTDIKACELFGKLLEDKL